jgi:hypothetical protein|tara:strand:+ start:200 stop:784 length:585 start_codon:yes stop_codon:yes gene_type:complete
MANTTFNGAVRSENGFKQISINSSTNVATDNFTVDSSGNVSGTGTMKMTGATNLLSDYESITDATKTITSADSGTIYGFNRAAGIVVTLPTPAAGITYTFFVETTFSGAGQIKTATTDGTDGFLGTAVVYDAGVASDNQSFNPAASNDVIDLGSIEQGWLTGGWIRLTGTNTTTWFVEAFLMGDATLATPFTDS